MLRWNVKKLAIASLAAASLFGVNLPQADAFWWRSWGSSGGSSGGSYGSYGSWGSSGGSYGSYGSYGSWGSSGGWGFRKHHRVGYWGSWGSSGGSYGSYGSWGSSGGSWGGSSGGSSGGFAGGHSTYSVPMDGAPMDGQVVPMDGAPAAPAAPAAPPVEKGASLNSAILNVAVPSEAKVYVNGLATTSTGSSRRFVSNGLERGFNYTYELRAEMVRNGQTLVETKTVKLKAGESADLNFSFDGNSQDEKVAKEPVRTTLTLLVPAEAKVYLSGNPTQSTGEVREFTTTRLSAGEVWNDYAVRVEFEQNGRMLTKEAKVSLKAGEVRELKFDFAAPQVAKLDK